MKCGNRILSRLNPALTMVEEISFFHPNTILQDLNPVNTLLNSGLDSSADGHHKAYKQNSLIVPEFHFGFLHRIFCFCLHPNHINYS